MESKYKSVLVSFMLVASLLQYASACWYDTESPHATAWDENADMCGTYSDNGKIVGGDDVSATYYWPWLGYMEISGRGFWCTVELIAPEWATTAAHCVDGFLASQLTITFGQANMAISSYFAQVKGVQQIIQHPSYTQVGGIRNDIAVLHLSSAVRYNSFVRPVCMQIPDPSWDRVYDNCWVAGWGRLATNGALPDRLQELKVNIVTNDDCQAMRQAGNPNLSDIDDNHICTLPTTTNSGICNGDSGGPLMCKFDDKRWILLGITSFHTGGCGNTNYPDVFARVSSFSQWITDVVDARGGPN